MKIKVAHYHPFGSSPTRPAHARDEASNSSANGRGTELTITGFIYVDSARSLSTCQIICEDLLTLVLVLAETLEPPRDQYGNPILPGYRKPFDSQTGRKASIKAHAALRAERERYATLPKLPITTNLNQRELSARLNAVRRAFRRHLAASVASTGSEGLKHAKAAREWLAVEQELLNPKRGSTRHLDHVSPMANVEPIASQKSPQKSDAVELVLPSETTNESSKVNPQSSGNQSVNPTSAFPASDQAASPSDVPF